MALLAALVAPLAELLSAATRVTVLTGAGVSAASGVPTFRGAGAVIVGSPLTAQCSREQSLQLRGQRHRPREQSYRPREQSYKPRE